MMKEAKIKHMYGCKRNDNITAERQELEKEAKTLALLAGLYDGEIRCSNLLEHYITIGEHSNK